MSRSSVIWSQVYGSEFGRFEKNEQNMLGLGKTFFLFEESNARPPVLSASGTSLGMSANRRLPDDMPLLAALRAAMRQHVLQGGHAGATLRSQLDAPSVVAKDVLLNLLHKRSLPSTGSGFGADSQLMQQGDGIGSSPLSIPELASLLARDSLVWHMRCVNNSGSSNGGFNASSMWDEQVPVVSPMSAKGSTTLPTPQHPHQLLLSLIAVAQREWKALMSVRVETVKVFQYAAVSANSTMEANGISCSLQPTGSSSSSSNVPAATTDDLLLVLSDRVNAAANLARKSVPFIPHVDAFGVLSLFNPTVHAIVAAAQSHPNPGPLVAPTVASLRLLFQELNPTTVGRQYFTHANLCSTSTSEDYFASLLRWADSPEDICLLAARGVPPGMRRLYYAKLLHLSIGVVPTASPQTTSTSRNLSFVSPFSQQRVTCPTPAAGTSPSQGSAIPCVVQNSVDPTVRVLTGIMQADANSHVGDSDKFFVFIDEVTTVSLALLHDPTVVQIRLRHVLRLLQRERELSSFSVVGDPTKMLGSAPIATSSLCVAPLCFVSGDVEELYELASAMYGELWIRIHCPSLDLFSLCFTFEELSSHFCPHVTFHCFTKLGFSPLAIALPWMVTGFAKLLEPLETLHLWDLLLAYHCMETSSTRPHASPLYLLAALAVSIISFRSGLVLACTTREQVEQVFDDGLKLRPVLLLQQLLFMS